MSICARVVIRFLASLKTPFLNKTVDAPRLTRRHFAARCRDVRVHRTATIALDAHAAMRIATTRARRLDRRARG